MKKKVKNLLPPVVYDFLKRILHYKYGWKGDYKNWDDAKKSSGGYDNSKILDKVKNSLLKVKNGEAIYERDSVIFDKTQYSWPLLTGLLLSAIRQKSLKVVDFGGSLGSTYFQNKKFLELIDNVSWSIIEQKHFVDIGKKEFEDDRLKFYYTIDECIEKEQPTILLLSSVLQYIEKPYELLTEILKYHFEYILIDRTPFSLDNKDKIKLQIVPSSIYEASYPCWFFDENIFKTYFLSKGYEIIEQFDALDGKNNKYHFKGMFLRINRAI